MKRVFAAALTLGLLIALSGVAHADTVTLEVVEAPPQNSILRGEDIFPVTIRANADSFLKAFSVFISIAEEPRPGQKVVNGAKSATWGAAETSSSTLHIDWNTQLVTPYNGLYQIIATAESHLNGSKDLFLSGYIVDNPPVQVTDVKAELSDGAPFLSWKANTEPDLTGYQVFRATGTSPYKLIGSPTARTFTDKEAPKDIEVKYYVVATRRSLASGEGWIASPPSVVRSFVIPSPGSDAQPVISGPQAAPAAPPVPKLVARPGGKITHQGFDEMLPYNGIPDSENAPAPVGDEELTVSEATYAPPPPINFRQIDKPPFIAAALLLIAAAAHMIRLAITLFSSNPGGLAESSPLATPPSSA